MAGNPTYKTFEEALHEAQACVNLPTALEWIEKYDKEQNYERRTIFVYHALALAAHKGFPCGIRFDSDEKEGKKWPVVAIQLPGVGEVAWHCKAYPHAFDGHSTEEKYKRIARYVEQSDKK